MSPLNLPITRVARQVVNNQVLVNKTKKGLENATKNLNVDRSRQSTSWLRKEKVKWTSKRMQR